MSALVEALVDAGPSPCMMRQNTGRELNPVTCATATSRLCLAMKHEAEAHLTHHMLATNAAYKSNTH